MTVAIYLLLGAGAGFLAGLLGIGGGIVIVPLLVLTFTATGFGSDLASHMAVATSLMTIVVTSTVATYTHQQHNAINWPLVRQLAPALMVGVGVGVLSTLQLSGDALRLIIGTYTIVIAVYMALDIAPNPARDIPKSLGLLSFGVLLGFMSAILGIAGGVILVPYLVWCNIAMRQAVATSAACGLPIAVMGAIGHLVVALIEPGNIEYSSGFIYWPAFLGIVLMSTPAARLGARYTHRLPASSLKKSFAIMLFVIGLYFHYQSLFS